MTHTDEQITDRIASSFRAPRHIEPARGERITAKIQLRHHESARAGVRKVVLVSTIAVATCVAFAGLILHQAPSSALAATAEGLEKLEHAGLVHYRQETTNEVFRDGRLARRTLVRTETWIDNQEGLRRRDVRTQAFDDQSSVEAIAAHSVTRDGFTRGWQTDLINGRQETRQTSGSSERSWPDDFDGTIASLRRLLARDEKDPQVEVQLFGDERLNGETVTVLKLTNTLTAPGDTVRAQDVQTFWLRKKDHVPLQIETLRVESRGGQHAVQFRSLTRITGYEIVPHSADEADVFDFVPHGEQTVTP